MLQKLLILNTSSEDLKNEIVTDVVAQISSEFRIISDKLINEPQPEFIDSKEASKILGVTLPTLNSWRNKKIIQAYRIGNQIRFNRFELNNSLKKIA